MDFKARLQLSMLTITNRANMPWDTGETSYDPARAEDG